jgi:hypothetical protein
MTSLGQGLLVKERGSTSKGGITMAEQHLIRPYVIALAIALVGWLAVPGGMSRSWARTQNQGPIVHQPPTRQALKTTVSDTITPRAGPRLTTPGPTTLDDYAREVQDRLQAAARLVNTPGIANVRLTIDPDGAVRQTEVTHLDGPEAIRSQLIAIVGQMNLPPLPTGTPVDALVVDTILVFNYPGNDIMDRFGRIS